ncbi:hypothetical protein [Cardiobacterium hominis]|nr:hypothetical protein [Cardiobacterium hominis]
MMQKYFNWINLVIFCVILLMVYIDARVMTQKQFNRIYLFLFFVFLLTRHVIFPITTVEFKKKLVFDSAKGDVIIADGNSRTPIMYAKRSLRPSTHRSLYPFMKFNINGETYYCDCNFSPCRDEDYFNKSAGNDTIEKLEMLQINKKRNCLVLKMDYLDMNYNIYDKPDYADYLLKDNELEKIEPRNNVENRFIIYCFIVFLLVFTLFKNAKNIFHHKH